MSTNSAATSISYSFTVRLAYPNRVGTLARIVSAIGKDGGDIGAVDIAGFEKELSEIKQKKHAKVLQNKLV